MSAIPSSRLLNTTVAVHRKVWSNLDGDRVATGTTAVYPAAVQPMRAADVQRHGLDASETGLMVYLLDDPAVAVRDTITWQGQSLSVLGGASDQSGRARCWAIPCVRRS
jgi:hypothetical protein